MKSVCVFIVAFLALSHGLNSAAQVKSQFGPLEGTWVGVRSEIENIAPRVLSPGETKLVFKDDRIVGTGFLAPEEVEYSFKLNSAPKPGQLDMWIDEKRKYQCAYEVAGETLRIACGRGSDVPRPTVVAATGRGNILLVLKRAT